MKNLLKKLVRRLVRSEDGWRRLDATLFRLCRYVNWQRDQYEEEQKVMFLQDAVRKICPDHIVMRGVFRNMRYLPDVPVDAALLAKLIGSYERELHPVLERVCKEKFSEIVNVGCAEGFYAVGLAMRIPSATVYAHDIKEDALRQCRQLAELNGVSERVRTGPACSPQALMDMNFKRGLIFCDCEGYEKELFTQDVATHLHDCDLIIEMHDFRDVTISSRIRSVFEATHDIETIESISAEEKARTYGFKELETYDLADRSRLLSEGRGSTMEWFYIRSRSAANGS